LNELILIEASLYNDSRFLCLYVPALNSNKIPRYKSFYEVKNVQLLKYDAYTWHYYVMSDDEFIYRTGCTFVTIKPFSDYPEQLVHVKIVLF
jgi:hypothetical protein